MSILCDAARPVNTPVPTVAEDAIADRLAFLADGGDEDDYRPGWQGWTPTAEDEEEALGLYLGSEGIEAESLSPIDSEWRAFNEGHNSGDLALAVADPLYYESLRERRPTVPVTETVAKGGTTGTTLSRRGMFGAMLAAFAAAPGAKVDGIPAELKAECLNFGEHTEFVVLPPGRQASPLPAGAFRSRLPLGGGWELLVVNLEDAA